MLATSVPKGGKLMCIKKGSIVDGATVRGLPGFRGVTIPEDVDEHGVLALFWLNVKPNLRSAWSPFVVSFPLSVSHMPMFWPKDKVEKFACGKLKGVRGTLFNFFFFFFFLLQFCHLHFLLPNSSFSPILV